MADIHLSHITKRFGTNEPAIEDLSLDVGDRELMVLAGPPGCGTSTILRMIVGLDDVTSGDIFIGDRRVTTEPPRNRNVAMVLHTYALYPHLTVFENIAVSLRFQKTPDSEIRARVERVAKLLKLIGLLDRKPAALSAGQRQRVALGRALVRDADAYLFDEPLLHLDAALRGLVRTEISRLHRGLGLTAVHATHDQLEAMNLGDRLAILRAGTVQQVDTPRDVYEQPVNMFVASFIGSPPINLIPGRVDGRVLQLPMVRIHMPDRVAAMVADRDVVIAGVRPEHFHANDGIAPGERARSATFAATVDVVEWVGRVQYAHIPYDLPPDLADPLAALSALAAELNIEHAQPELIVQLDPACRFAEGTDVGLSLDTSRLHLFDPLSGANLTVNATVGASAT
ncbi:MAG: ABC transporter ATP-binding protein [Ilumatobacteraceae bacterium]